MKKQTVIIIALLVGLIASSCAESTMQSKIPGESADAAENPKISATDSTEKESGAVTPTTPSDLSSETTGNEAEDGSAIETAEPTVPMEPLVNPLSGLPANDPETLDLPPALVSITNFPPTARPQAGLSFSPIVFELFIGEGMTRFLALFYGNFPEASVPENHALDPEEFAQTAGEPVIGPIRSGRLPYEHLRKLYSGFIVMASAYSKVMDQLNEYVNVYGDDRMDINSALIDTNELKALAASNQEALGSAQLTGMSFDPQPPEGGRTAHSLWIFFSYLNQVFWRYNPEDGSYHRWQDKADGSSFVEQTDRLNGEPLAYENVIILFADHEVQAANLIDVALLYVKRGNAKLLRDGQIYDLYWTTKSEAYEQTTGKFRPIRFIDAEGNPFPLKPGQTWVEIVPNYIACWETVNSEKYNQLAAGRSKGSGYWGLYFKLDE